MATEPLDKLLNEFIEAWNAAERPRVDDYVARAPEGERDELAGLIGAFLEIAPTPDYSPAQLAELRQDPTVQNLTALIDSPSGPWPALLPRLRGRARLTRDQVVAQLAGLLGVAGREEKVKRYYHQMESGTIEPQGVSRKVLEALGKVFAVDARELERAGGFGIEPPGAAAGAFLRADDDAAPAESLDVAATPASPAPMDDIDELFRGGR